MLRGKSINIYMPDGNPKGIKLCDMPDSIVKAILIPRNELKNSYTRVELNSQGVYILVGEKDELGKPMIYIGEAEVLLDRIKKHNQKKDFWNLVICFISEKNNLNKAHIKFLENYLYTEAKEISKCNFDNSVIPTKSNLDEQQRTFIMNFYDDLKILSSTLGLNIFEKNNKIKSNLYYCKGKDAFASGEYTGDGLIVFKGSTSNLKESNTAGNWVIGMRKKLIEKNILIKKDNIFIFTENYTFSSPSAAAAVVLARRANGWREWKDDKHKTMDEKIRQVKLN